MAINASTVSKCSTVSVTVAHVVAYLTHSLIVRYSATTIMKLQLSLEANLSAHFASSWDSSEPLRGSGRRCLTLSPNSLPPRPVYAACIAADVNWSEWIKILGNVEFDLFVDPGSVRVRCGAAARPFTVWSAQSSAEAKAQKDLDELKLQAQLRAQAAARVTAVLGARQEKKTFAQRVIEEDQEDDDEIFTMIADEVSAPTWLTPMLDQFPYPTTTTTTLPLRRSSVSPVSDVSTHSRSSSRSGLSAFSSNSYDSATSQSSFVTTATSVSAEKNEAAPEAKIMSRRERARQARVFIDSNKKEVTSYEGGRTTVLTGGVMLGAAASKAKVVEAPKKVNATGVATGSWRRV